MLKKAVLLIFACAVIFALGVFLGGVSDRFLTQQSRLFNTSTVLQQVQTLSQLVTVKYVLEKVVVLDDVKWYGESRVLLVAHGIVKAGVDLGKLQPADIKISGKKIIINLPRPTLTDVYLDDHRTEVLERSTGITRLFDKDLEQNARRQAVEDLRLAALENGIIKDSDDRARAQLSGLFYQIGFTEVEFRSR